MKNNYLIFTAKALRLWGFLLFVASSVQAQPYNVAKLESSLENTEEDSLKIEILNKLHLANKGVNNRKAFTYAKQAMIIAKKTGNEKRIMKLYGLFGNSYRDIGMPQVALEWYLRGLKLFEKQANFPAISFLETDIGNCYYDLKSWTLAVQHYELAYEVGKQVNFYAGMATAKDNIGLVAEAQNNHQLGLKLHQEALQIRYKDGDLHGLAFTYKNMGQAYSNLKLYVTAHKFLDSAALYFLKIKDTLGWAEVRLISARTYSKQGNTLACLYNLNRLLPILKRHNGNKLLVKVRKELSIHYKNEQNYLNALNILSPGIQEANTLGSYADLYNIYNDLSNLYRAMGEDHKALAMFRQAVAYKDSITIESNEKLSNSSWIIYQLQAKDEEVAKYKAEGLTNASILDSQRRNNKWLWAVLVCALSAGVIFLLLYRNKKARSKALQRQNSIIARQKADLDKHSKELDKARIVAEKSLAARSEFLSNMSHEIRTPMNAIIGYSELMLENPKHPQHLDYLKSIHHASKNLLVVINDILDLTKIESDEVSFENIPFRLDKMLDEIHKLLRINWSEKSVTVEVKIAENLPKWFKGDPTRLYQIILNLANNAMKFTERGYVKISVHALSQNPQYSHLEFSIADTGIGIASDKLIDIFQNFKQASTDTTRKFGGTGLGLAISKKLIEKQGGEISVESELGKGSTFSYNLMMGIPSSFEIDDSEPKPMPEIGSKPLGGRHILCAEDNLLNQHLIRQILESWGATVTIVGDGQLAVEAVTNYHFDLVLMDIQMPHLDGMDATKQIRSMKNNPLSDSLPIYGLTADVLEETRQAARQAGMDGVILKPINKSLLLDTLLQHLQQQIIKIREQI